jgi:hypothetical protein
MSKVVEFKAPPKRVSNTYKGWNYTVVFTPSTGLWEWTITKTQTITHTETAADLKTAVKAAQRFIDTLV